MPTVRFTEGICIENYADIQLIGTNCDFNGAAGYSCGSVWAIRQVGSSSWSVQGCGAETGLSAPKCMNYPGIVSGPLVDGPDATNIDPVPTFTPSGDDPTC